MQTTRLLQQRVICSLLWGVLLVTSALSLSAQTAYKGVKTPPQDLTVDGSLETKAYVRGVSPSGRYIWAAYYYNQAAYVYDTELKKCIWQKSNAGTEIDIKYVSDEGTSYIKRIGRRRSASLTRGRRSPSPLLIATTL